MIDTIPDESRMCHRCNFDKSCRDLVLSKKCNRWSNIRFEAHPQTGKPGDIWTCIDDQSALLMLIIAQQNNMVTAELNKLRNETKEAHDANLAMAAIAVQRSRDAVKETIQNSLNYIPYQDINSTALLPNSSNIPVEKSNGS